MQICAFVYCFICLFFAHSFVVLSLGPMSSYYNTQTSADFAVNIYRRVADQEEGKNVLLSPLNTTIALTMLYDGADGDTEKEIKKVLFYGVKDHLIHPQISRIIVDFVKTKSALELHLANRIYFQKKFRLIHKYVAKIRKLYETPLKSVDFTKKVNKVRLSINEWVMKRTDRKCKDLLSTDGTIQNATMLLVNVIYFKGEWQIKFDKSETKKNVFHSTPNMNTEVQMMCALDVSLPYNNCDDVQVFGIPYRALNLVMFVFLPKGNYGLTTFEEKLTGKLLIDMIKKCKEHSVNIRLPRFQMESLFELDDALKRLGMTHMFDQADFSMMTRQPKFSLTHVIHKAIIEVTEQGSASANFASVLTSSSDSHVVQLTADHSFFFVVCDINTLNMLFTGRFTNI